MSFFQNTCKPKGLGGKIMVNMMNIGHASMAEWGFTHIEIQDDAACLDIGCGGGANISKLLEKARQGKVIGSFLLTIIPLNKSQRLWQTPVSKRFTDPKISFGVCLSNTIIDNILSI